MPQIEAAGGADTDADIAALTDSTLSASPQATHSNGVTGGYSLTAHSSTFPKLEFLRHLLVSREGDRREAILLRQGKGWFQGSGMGHEALGVMAYCLREDDVLFPCYRDRTLMLARGVPPRQLALDFLAREGASSQARNLPGHFSDGPRKVFSIASPTASQCLPAAGAAWGFKQDGRGGVALCDIGDASTRQGEFYEAICFAVQEKLPVVFVVEDNGYGISTPTTRLLPFRLGIFAEDLVTHINGRDAFAVYDTVSAAVERARRGDGPSLIWCEVDRLGSHTSADDQRVYRAMSEIEEMQQRDPLRLYAERLIASGDVTEDEWKRMQAEITAEIDRIYREVDESVPFPSPDGVLDHLYGPAVVSNSLPVQPEGQTETIVGAINRTLRAGLETFDRMVMFGEDIEDPKGGVFGFTKGLSTAFPGRVVNSPLAEATIIGTAVGLAATGYRPVFELQFIDFLTPGFNQLVSQVATLRWRSKGEWKCPMVLYAPYGAYLPGGGMWHSQSNDGWWAHIPGIGVAIPGTPEDAAGLFWSAMHYEDASLILIPKHIFRARMPVTKFEPVPFGKARIAREGGDVTVVTWGNCLEIAGIAAEQMAQEGVSVEIVDLRTLVPCDWETVQASLTKTGRLVVIHEDTRTCGFGQAVIAEMTNRAERFYTLLSPPQLVARPDVHVPFCPSLELSILPDVEDLIGAIRNTLE